MSRSDNVTPSLARPKLRRNLVELYDTIAMLAERNNELQDQLELADRINGRLLRELEALRAAGKAVSHKIRT